MKTLFAARGRPAFGGLVAFALFAMAAFFYSTAGGSQNHVAIVMVLNAIMVVGTQLFAGNSGVLSFGHVGLAAIAAYITAILSAPAAVKTLTIPDAPLGLAAVHLSVPLAVLMAVLLTTVIGALIGLAVCRLHGIAASIVTFAILMVVNSVIINWKPLTGGAEAFYGVPVATTIGWALVALMATVLTGRLFTHSRVGLRVRAAREDETAASCLGIQVHRTRYVSWVISVVFGALGGALYAHLLGAINPGVFYEPLMFLQVAMLVLGGMYSVTGALLGTAVVTFVSEFMRWLGDGPMIAGFRFPVIYGLSGMVYGAIILVSMIWRPGGFLDDKEIDDAWGWWKRRRAKRAAEEPALAVGSAAGPGRVPAVRPAALQDVGVATEQTAEVRLAVSLGLAAATPAPDLSASARGGDSGPVLPHERGVEPLLSIRDATMHFAGLRAVDRASLDVYPGEIVGLIGPNGAGKTTLINMVSALYKATSGDIVFRGRSINELPVFEIARLGVARTFQSIRLFGHLSVSENVEVCARTAKQYRPSSHRPAERILEQFGLDHLAQRKAGTLPYGLQRQVEMARAVALGPDLLLLDEPAAGTNDFESQQLAANIRRVRDLEKCAILLIDHDLPFVMNLCDRVYVLDAGVVIAEGTPRQIQDDPKVKEAYLGSRAVGAGRGGAVE